MAIQATSDVESQYRVLRAGAGMVDRGARGTLDALGPDAAEFLQGQVTNDVEALAPGTGCYAALLNPKGKILADLRVLVRSPEEIWLDTEEAAREALFTTLNRYTIGRRVELADRTRERAIITLIGPGSREAVGATVPEDEHSSVVAKLDGVEALVVRTDLGVDVFASAADEGELRSALEARGVVPVSEEAAEIVRIESGRPRYGVDMSDDNFPAELGLEERAVSFTKGCYVGQEPVARMHYRGHPNRHLRGLLLSEPAAAGEAVFSGDREIGRTTSPCVSPRLGPIALAVVRREVEPPAPVAIGASRLSANVIQLPFPDQS